MDHRLMVFIDGTNLLNELGRTEIPHSNGKSYKLGWRLNQHDPPPEVFDLIYSAIKCAGWRRSSIGGIRPFEYRRLYWFGSYEGGEQVWKRYVDAAKQHHFQPLVLKKQTKGEKGVDMALALEMLTNALNQNFDVGALMAGDEDFVGLVGEAKRYGQTIEGFFFKGRMAPRLVLELDHVHPLQTSLESLAQEKKDKLIDACLESSKQRRAPGNLKRALDEAAERLRIAIKEGRTEIQDETDGLGESLNEYLTPDGGFLSELVLQVRPRTSSVWDE